MVSFLQAFPPQNYNNSPTGSAPFTFPDLIAQITFGEK